MWTDADIDTGSHFSLFLITVIINKSVTKLCNHIKPHFVRHNMKLKENTRVPSFVLTC